MLHNKGQKHRLVFLSSVLLSLLLSHDQLGIGRANDTYYPFDNEGVFLMKESGDWGSRKSSDY